MNQCLFSELLLSLVNLLELPGLYKHVGYAFDCGRGEAEACLYCTSELLQLQPRAQALSSGKERPWSELVTCHPDSGW